MTNPYAGRSHADLAELARELLLAGHLIDRSGMPHLIARLGRDGMRDIAIDEWRSASPIYTPRMQQLLGFEGDTVETIFKGMQLDVGAPPEFMDFRYEVHDDHHGSFHLDHCGALMDVEPMGDDYVRAMCHDIEDPTFDATAAVTNPRARMRPVHRPPRTPADRSPHCAWTVTIEPDVEPLPFPPGASALATSYAARLPLATPTPGLPDDDGWTSYDSPLDPDLVMERFSSATLSAICDEVALQGHLLARAYLVEVADRLGSDEAIALGIKAATGIAGLVAKRLAALVGGAPGVDAVAAVLDVHPMFLPRSYVDLRTHRPQLTLVLGEGPAPGVDALRISIGAGSPPLAEPDALTWTALLAGPGGDAIVAAAVQCAQPRARLTRVEASSAEAAAWTVSVDPAHDPVPQPDEVTLTEFSTGAAFAFERRS